MFVKILTSAVIKDNADDKINKIEKSGKKSSLSKKDLKKLQ